ncbi:MAG TPA: hypothetical protein VLJ11_15760 [Bryobacteraceae bacterium]|nr:hypothetical protein [Bryobacteraceae bacterium]
MTLNSLRPSLLIAAMVAVQAGYPQNRVTLTDDAYHLKYWEPSPYNAAYTEWWYFNLYDTKNDIQAIFSYQLVNRLNLITPGLSYVAAVVYKGDQFIPAVDLYPAVLFNASYSAANVSVGLNTISILDKNHYAISGASTDGRLSWKLNYQRQAPSWFAADHANVGPFDWEQMSWLLYMPRADVRGTLTIDGQSYTIESSGYHDHNWGEWVFQTVNWNWAQYSEPGLTFGLGDFIGDPSGRASLDLWGKRVVFSANEYKLVHTKWAFDPATNLPYPTQSVFTAQKDDLTVRIVMDVQKSAPLTAGPPPALVIFEQPTHFEGEITLHYNWLRSRYPSQVTVSRNTQPLRPAHRSGRSAQRWREILFRDKGLLDDGTIASDSVAKLRSEALLG